jgi:hypothetical protein
LENVENERSRNFQFCSEKEEFHEIHYIAKTPIIPKEYQGFGASRFTKINIFYKFHDFYEFP